MFMLAYIVLGLNRLAIMHGSNIIVCLWCNNYFVCAHSYLKVYTIKMNIIIIARRDSVMHDNYRQYLLNIYRVSKQKGEGNLSEELLLKDLESGDFERIMLVVHGDRLVTQRLGPKDFTCLHYASYHGNVKIVKMIIDRCGEVALHRVKLASLCLY